MVPTTLVQRMADESGNPQGFDTSAWLSDWLVRAVLAVGGRQPLDVLKEPGSLKLVRNLLQALRVADALRRCA